MVPLCVESMSAITNHLYAMERRLDALLEAESIFFAVSYNQCISADKKFYDQPVSWDEIKLFFLGLKTHLQKAAFHEEFKTKIEESLVKKQILEKKKGGGILSLSFSSTPYIEITYALADRKYELMHADNQIDLTTMDKVSDVDGVHSQFPGTIRSLANIFSKVFADINFEFNDGVDTNTYSASDVVGGLLAACFP
jgi:hypothetical protein